MTAPSKWLAVALTVGLLSACTKYRVLVDVGTDAGDAAVDRDAGGTETDAGENRNESDGSVPDGPASDGTAPTDVRPDVRLDAAIDAATCPPSSTFSASVFCDNVAFACGFAGTDQYASAAACLTIYVSFTASKQSCLTTQACRATESVLQNSGLGDFFCGHVAPSGTFCP